MSMFSKLLRTLAVVLSLVAVPVSAGERPVVVELFTSQGCSSCPPADALMHKLAKRGDVIALALHVDYWDYIGWKDQFADPAHAKRQRGYADRAGRRSIYTPQMIVNGQTSIVGARGMELSDAINAHQADRNAVELSLSLTGTALQIDASNAGNATDMEVHVLRYQPKRDIKILRGENAGHAFTYMNVVQDWQVVAEWSGQEALSRRVEIAGDMPVVVLVQGADHGPILAAQRLR